MNKAKSPERSVHCVEKRAYPHSMKSLRYVIICIILFSLFIYFPTVSGESDEWLTIENEFFIINYHPGQGEEAEETLDCAMWVRENTLQKYPHILNLKVTITIYSDQDELKEKEGAYTAISYVGKSRASIGILSPSWTGSWGGYEGLDYPFRRILNHEYVHCPFYIDLYTKSRGYKDPQSWFSQGLAEYISDNYLPCYVDRIRESVEHGSFTISEPYTWGLYIVEYMYSKYGMDKVIDIIKSDESTFTGALEEELGTTPLVFEDGWRRYVADKFGVEYELYNLTQLAPVNITLTEFVSEMAEMDELISSLNATIEIMSKEKSYLEIEYEALEENYADLMADLDSLMDESNSLMIEYDNKISEYDELQSDYDSLYSEYQTMRSSYEELTIRYGELNSKQEKTIFSTEFTYVFIAATILFMITTIYYGSLRKGLGPPSH